MSFSIQDLRYRYDGAPTEVLAGITAEIEPGRKTAIVGLSGSGKSTLLSLLGLLMGNAARAKRAVSGQLVYKRGNGQTQELLGLPEQERENWRLVKYGFVLQSAYLLPHFTGAHNVMMPLALLGLNSEERQMTFDKKLELLGSLKESFRQTLMEKPAWCLSGGERQRAAVLRAVIHDPEVIFADEPTSNLDVVNREIVLAMLNQWQSLDERVPRTLILVTHDVPLALTADKILILRAGRLVRRKGPENTPDSDGWTKGDLGDNPETRLEQLIKNGNDEEANNSCSGSHT